MMFAPVARGIRRRLVVAAVTGVVSITGCSEAPAPAPTHPTSAVTTAPRPTPSTPRPMPSTPAPNRTTSIQASKPAGTLRAQPTKKAGTKATDAMAQCLVRNPYTHKTACKAEAKAVIDEAWREAVADQKRANAAKARAREQVERVARAEQQAELQQERDRCTRGDCGDAPGLKDYNAFEEGDVR